MSKESILKLCKGILEAEQDEIYAFDCTGIYCEDCPIGRVNNNGISCHDNTEEDIIAAAKKYIAENTEEKEVENKFKVGDRVKKNNGKVFSNGDYVVTVKKVDGCKIWFKETDSFLTDKKIKLAEETTKKPNTELTFKEFVNEAEEGKIYVSESGAEFYKEDKKIIINLDRESQIIIIPDETILTLKKQEYTFTEAIEKAREGNTITSLVSEEFYSPVEVKSGKAIFELKEIEGKWSVED